MQAPNTIDIDSATIGNSTAPANTSRALAIEVNIEVEDDPEEDYWLWAAASRRQSAAVVNLIRP
ncbi:hypothetical protein [Chitinimonas sp. BJB300]|uniref:hypothetical protein n=1 Tax=Chitinimonas sp. BJB300 TaxID=1559339 RepID=UPI000C10B915|nr:hypothetical protein [Chitinimonas sp. BJB300]PHV10517.1 hypothetical protein CSQ89_15760 [Chitinimonas sp. BJB300]TSJ84618.1 hypothetical protein FG002_019495 [Chitinimonas sp. BJB300]